MKKIVSYCTFWLVIISILLITINITGYDDKNILLIGFNPLLTIIVYIEPFRSILWNDGPNLNIYIAHLLSSILYGITIDSIIHVIKKHYQKQKTFNSSE